MRCVLLLRTALAVFLIVNPLTNAESANAFSAHVNASTQGDIVEGLETGATITLQVNIQLLSYSIVQEWHTGIAIVGLTGVTINGRNHSIDGRGTMRVLYLAESTVFLNDLTIQNGYVSVAGRRGGSTMQGHGAGFLAHASAITMTRCRLLKNVATKQGGGGYAAGGTLTMISSTIAGNEAYAGFGLFVSGVGGSDHKGAAVLSNCLVMGNKGFGGAVYLFIGASVTLSGCDFHGNTGASGADVFLHGEATKSIYRDTFAVISTCPEGAFLAAASTASSGGQGPAMLDCAGNDDTPCPVAYVLV